MKKQTNIYDVLFEEDRKLTKVEYANLRCKQNDGFMNADFFRRNIFNATSRGNRTHYVRPKLIGEYKNNKKVFISHSLHRRHADVLSLIYSDNNFVSKPTESGSFNIHLSLYRIAQLMGYKHPHKRTNDVKKFINDLRWTDFIINKEGVGEYRDTILGGAFFDENKDTFIIKVGGISAKILAHTTGIRFSQDITHRIVSIPNHLPKLKALLRFILSNKPTSNGYTLSFLYSKFNVGVCGSPSVIRNDKYLFRKELLDNSELLLSFNIVYVHEERKIYYKEQLQDISFELSVPQRKILSALDDDKVFSFEGKIISINDVSYTISSVTFISDDVVDLVLINNDTNERRGSKGVSVELVKRYIGMF